MEMRPPKKTHCIRLHGPWRIEATKTSTATAPERFNAPAAWNEICVLPLSVLGSISRRFGRPTGISASQTLELVISPPGAPYAVFLNGVEIGPSTNNVATNDTTANNAPGQNTAPTEESRYDITRRIELRNELKLVFSAPAAVEGVLPTNSTAFRLGDVRLEIRDRPNDA